MNYEFAHKKTRAGMMRGGVLCGLAVVLSAGPARMARAQADAVALPVGTPWKVDTFYENDTRVRGKDATGERVGLSKFRNTLQVEADKKTASGWGFHATLRGTVDGVYRLNSDQFGRDAGGPVQLGNTAAPVFQSLGAPFLNTPTVPHGGGISKAIATALGLPPSNLFGINTSNPNAPFYTPNAGLRVLGDRWHGNAGQVAVAVPVRPCDIDGRGCTDFGGYGDLTRSQLEAPEFNDRLDFIRELYVKNTYSLANGKNLFLKIGKQQVVWGRTDLFRVLDVINPVDYSRNNIYDELQDIRIPMWIAQAEYRMGASESMQDRNLQVVWNFDKFRPNNLGQCGSPNSALDAGCLLRGFKTLWDYGGTVANFAAVPPGTPGMYAATDFGPHQEGIRNVYLPAWTLANTQLGLKYEAVTAGGLSFSLNALTYRSQLPSLRGIDATTLQRNMFTGELQTTSNNLAYDVYYPRVNLVGGSMDFQLDAVGAAVRVEAALSHGEEFANTAQPRGFSKNRVFRSVIGVDRPVILSFVNPTRATLFSAQVFYQHIVDHELYDRPLGRIGMPDWKDNVTATLLIKGFLSGDRVSPQVIIAHDVKARATVVSPSLDWLVSDNLKLSFGANVKTSDNVERWAFDDGRSFNPYPPFTQYPAAGQAAVQGSWGLGGIEPLGRFRAGPIGAAWKENEAFVTLRYKF
jgi:hypothetical protein